MEQLVQLFVVLDSQLQVSGDDPGLLVVFSSVASQLKDLSSQILEHSSKVEWGSSTNSPSVVALADKSVDSSNWELQSSSA